MARIDLLPAVDRQSRDDADLAALAITELGQLLVQGWGLFGGKYMAAGCDER
ncbi:hypothetical protein D9M68_1004960 [compost metagenome]